MHQAEHSPQRQHVCLQKQAAFCTKAQSTLWKRLLLGSLYNSLREVMRLRTSASLNFTTESYQWDLKSLHWVQRWHYFNRETRRLSTYQAHTGTWVLRLQLFPQPAQPTVSGDSVTPYAPLLCHLWLHSCSVALYSPQCCWYWRTASYPAHWSLLTAVPYCMEGSPGCSIHICC